MNSRHRPAEIFALSRFNFHENERVFLAADDVDLAAPVALEIAIKNLVTVLSQEPARQFFSTRAAGVNVLR